MCCASVVVKYIDQGILLRLPPELESEEKGRARELTSLDMRVLQDGKLAQADFLNKTIVLHLGELVKAQRVGQAVRIGVQLVAGVKLVTKENFVADTSLRTGNATGILEYLDGCARIVG